MQRNKYVGSLFLHLYLRRIKIALKMMLKNKNIKISPFRWDVHITCSSNMHCFSIQNGVSLQTFKGPNIVTVSLKHTTFTPNPPNQRAHGPWIAHLKSCHKERMLTIKYKTHFSNTLVHLGYLSDHNQRLPIHLVHSKYTYLHNFNVWPFYPAQNVRGVHKVKLA